MSSRPLPVVEIVELEVRRGGRLAARLPLISINKGEMLALMGPNGAGKSSVLLAMALLLPARWRSYRFMGTEVDASRALLVRRQMAVVFQDPLLLHGSVLHNVMLGLRIRGVPDDEAREQAMSWLARLGVDHLALRPAQALSGGEAQRVNIARALVLRPSLLLLDEPFSGLDVLSRISLLNDIRPLLRQTGTSAVLVTHEFSEAALLADKVTVMDRGEPVQTGTPQDILKSPADPLVAKLVDFTKNIASALAAEDVRGDG